MKLNIKTKPRGSVSASFNLIVLAALLAGFTAPAAPVGTAFTYQGQLQTDSGPANGLYDLRFRLYDVATLGTPVAMGITNSAVVVSNGYFTVALDFGAAFTEARWLDISVRTNGSPAPFTPLSPRQAITPTPNAIVASQLSGTLTDTQLGTNVALLDRNNQAFTGNNTFAGNVGIGTTSPIERLHVASSSGPALRVENLGSGTAALQLADTDQEYELRLTSGNKLTFFDLTAGSLARLTLDQTGNVGIGTSNPADNLHINGGVTATTFTGSGAGLTGLNVSANEITSGTLADARLGANVALLNRNNQAFTGDNSFSGKIGIGTTTPSEELHIVAGSGTEVRVENTGSGSAALGLLNADREYSVRMTGSEDFVVRDVTGGNVDRLTITTNGNVGIGTSSPKQALHVDGDYYGKGHFYLYAYEGDGTNGSAYVQARDDSGTSSIALRFRTQLNGNIVENMQLGTDGVTYVNVLTITGGADIAEPFQIHNDAEVEPGMVVSIDPDRAGELRLSTSAYDPTVAGIISGAGGVKTGMTLQQTGTLADGKHPVALTGRVWCNVDADSAAVKPGDLLTTSNTPGHAMKALDHGRSQGAIIGKAMTRLDQGRGLVLVLVSLQ